MKTPSSLNVVLCSPGTKLFGPSQVSWILSQQPLEQLRLVREVMGRCSQAVVLPGFGIGSPCPLSRSSEVEGRGFPRGPTTSPSQMAHPVCPSGPEAFFSAVVGRLPHYMRKRSRSQVDRAHTGLQRSLPQPHAQGCRGFGENWRWRCSANFGPSVSL
ncbi:unnamed protein product [Pieris macdunnoughi]|uniref:Uncharacterized protein n=1 Tax=Pieris macdunnoughi TaxID=345717 RepID=A0A821VSR5_9NEOP|nr:unnamed protein product [Pieris macdunnoughi]